MDDTLQLTAEEMKNLSETMQGLTDAFCVWFDAFVDSTVPPRINWLANNHHKQRVRKKNRHRMYALFRRLLDSGEATT